jgi:hypothetical protein
MPDQTTRGAARAASPVLEDQPRTVQPEVRSLLANLDHRPPKDSYIPVCQPLGNVIGLLVRLPCFLILSVALQLFLGFLALNHLIGPLSDLFKTIGFHTIRPPT